MQTNNLHDAEELLQDVFFKAAKQLHRFKGKSTFKTWLFKIARNTVIDYYRKGKPQDKEVGIEDYLIEQLKQSESAEHIALRGIHFSEVMESLKKLPSHYQAVLHLRFIEGFTIKETAEIMGKSVLSVKAIQRRARQSLTEQINMEVATDE
jgi:RNA polymerase sigma-70 factor (ECF subfamily)